jgi:hypothetical protein
MPAALLHVDSRKRVTLPVEANVASGEDLEMEILRDGRIVLTPIVRVPKHQMWLLNPEVDRLIKEALQDTEPSLDLSAPGAIAAIRARRVRK